MRSVTKRGLRLFYSEDEDSSDDGNKMALATVKTIIYCYSMPVLKMIFIEISYLPNAYFHRNIQFKIS